jgi:long-chain acyl-CoA synthetase
MFNLSTILESTAKERPGHPAIIFDQVRLTYAQLEGAACQVANALTAAGIEKGDRVAIMLPNTPHFPIAYYGILKVGAIVVPINVLFKAAELKYHLEDSGARLLIAFEAFAEPAFAGFEAAGTCEQLWFVTADPAGPAPKEGKGVSTLAARMKDQAPKFDTVWMSENDTAVILYTSGTTGRPKGAELSHFNLTMNTIVCRDLLTYNSESVSLCVLPLFHSFGQTCVMNAAVVSGATISLMARFEPERVLEVLARDRVTNFTGVPTMYWALLNAAKPETIAAAGETLRFCASGGAAMPVELMKKFEEAFGVTILEGYGLSETSPVATFNISVERRKPGSIGLPIWGVDVKLVDDDGKPVPQGERGEIAIRGHNIMKGYWQKPQETADAMRGGWFHSGDIGYMDEEGYTYIVDRKKDLILRGGFNVYPREVEEMLMQHPAISLCAVVGVADERLGEEVKAYVIPKDGVALTQEDLISWCRENMAATKVPRIVEFREALPMTATGKILKRELR